MFIWIIEHIIGNLPVWVWAFVAGGGAAAYIISGFIAKVPNPQIKMIAFITKYAGIAALLFGIFMCGGAGVTAALQGAVAEMQDKVAKSEQQSNDANKALDAALKDKKDNNKQAQVIIQERIIHDAAQMDASCKVDPIAIKDLNDAAVGDIK